MIYNYTRLSIYSSTQLNFFFIVLPIAQRILFVTGFPTLGFFVLKSKLASERRSPQLPTHNRAVCPRISLGQEGTASLSTNVPPPPIPLRGSLLDTLDGLVWGREMANLEDRYNWLACIGEVVIKILLLLLWYMFQYCSHCIFACCMPLAKLICIHTEEILVRFVDYGCQQSLKIFGSLLLKSGIFKQIYTGIIRFTLEVVKIARLTIYVFIGL